jgi:hypothetical protein
MAGFNAAAQMHEVQERAEHAEGKEKFIPIAAAVIAVFAAIATLMSNHSSIKGLEARTLAGISQTKAADQYNYYESSRMKMEVDQGLLDSGLVSSAAARARLESRVRKETAKSTRILRQANAYQRESDASMGQGEHTMTSYEKFEVSTTLFEVCVVLVSISALMKTRAFLWTSVPAVAIAFIFFFIGLAQR